MDVNWVTLKFGVFVFLVKQGPNRIILWFVWVLFVYTSLVKSFSARDHVRPTGLWCTVLPNTELGVGQDDQARVFNAI